MKNILILTLGLLALTQSAFAERESWYFNFGLGGAAPTYPVELKIALDAVKAAGATNTPVAVDMAFYWPLGTTNLLGVAIEGASDQYVLGAEKMSIVQSGIFLSGMTFLGSEPGEGVYFRGDIGPANLGVTIESGGLTATSTSKTGIGAGAGLGYGIAFSSTRILLQLSYMTRKVESENYGLTAFTISGLF